VGDRARDLGVSIEVEDELGDESLVVDSEQVGRALTNLVTNAVEAAGDAGAKDAGTVTISGRLAPDEEGMFSIVVTDSGPGIPEALLPKLFQPFVTTRDEGTGLGLANVKKIAEYHGGAVTAENRERGAAFTLTLPRRTAR
jgi:signal transduction histidine kinase